MIQRQTDAAFINQVLNHPKVRPYVASANEGVIDITPAVENKLNVLLMGEFGGCMFFWVQPGMYEVHTQVLPEGRGKWTKAMTAACVHHMFTRTDCFDIITRVPDGHIAAKAAAIQQGMTHEFTRPAECKWLGEIVDAHIYSFRIQDWARTAPYLVEIGEMLHQRMHEEAKRLGITATPHANDENHNRYLGVAYEMAANGHPMKALQWYNRWAIVSRHKPISLVALEPPTFAFDIGLMKLINGDIEVSLPC